MADRWQHRQTNGVITGSVKSILSDKGPTKTQALAVATLFPTGGILLSLSGLALAASVVGFGLLAPIFLLFSLVLVPATCVIDGLCCHWLPYFDAVICKLTLGSLGLGGLSSLVCFGRAARDLVTKAPDEIEQSKRKMAEAAATIGHKAKDTAQAILSKAQEAAAKTLSRVN